MARNLTDSIVTFVSTWEKVVSVKLTEFATKDSEERKASEEKDEKMVELFSDACFSYIYEWLEVGEDEDGNSFIKPHKAKKRPGDAIEPTKMRYNDHPCGADIIDYFCNHPTGEYEDASSVSSSVYRILKKLVDDDRLEKHGDCYFSVTIDQKRETMAIELARLTSLKKDCFFSISSKTYIIFFQTTKLDFKNEKHFFEKYLGKDLFDMMAYENKLIIMLRGKKERGISVGNVLRQTVKDAYKLQQTVLKQK